jgi:hypothetical protein
MSFFGPTRCGWGLSPRGPYLRMSRAQPLCVEGAVTMEASHHVAMGWLGDERSCKTDCCAFGGWCGGEYITRGAHRTLPLNLYPPPTCLLYLCVLSCSFVRSLAPSLACAWVHTHAFSILYSAHTPPETTFCFGRVDSPHTHIPTWIILSDRDQVAPRDFHYCWSTNLYFF